MYISKHLKQHLESRKLQKWICHWYSFSPKQSSFFALEPWHLLFLFPGIFFAQEYSFPIIIQISAYTPLPHRGHPCSLHLKYTPSPCCFSPFSCFILFILSTLSKMTYLLVCIFCLLLWDWKPHKNRNLVYLTHHCPLNSAVGLAH